MSGYIYYSRITVPLCHTVGYTPIRTEPWIRRRYYVNITHRWIWMDILSTLIKLSMINLSCIITSIVKKRIIFLAFYVHALLTSINRRDLIDGMSTLTYLLDFVHQRHYNVDFSLSVNVSVATSVNASINASWSPMPQSVFNSISYLRWYTVHLK